jgi:hypothetical protein
MTDVHVRACDRTIPAYSHESAPVTKDSFTLLLEDKSPRSAFKIIPSNKSTRFRFFFRRGIVLCEASSCLNVSRWNLEQVDAHTASRNHWPVMVTSPSTDTALVIVGVRVWRITPTSRPLPALSAASVSVKHSRTIVPIVARIEV